MAIKDSKKDEYYGHSILLLESICEVENPQTFLGEFFKKHNDNNNNNNNNNNKNSLFKELVQIIGLMMNLMINLNN